jgi:hypothetical protein
MKCCDVLRFVKVRHPFSKGLISETVWLGAFRVCWKSSNENPPFSKAVEQHDDPLLVARVVFEILTVGLLEPCSASEVSDQKGPFKRGDKLQPSFHVVQAHAHSVKDFVEHA